MTTTLAPSLGHAPLYTQVGTGASPGYDAIDRRRSYGAGVQEGVMDVHCFEATQRGLGANMSVDISANQFDTLGSGLAALVRGTGVVGQGFYAIPGHSAVINEAIGAAHATLPRVDAVVLEVRDTTHDGSGFNDVRIRVIAGTATAGATLDNRTGAANLASACPGGYILLSDVLVGAAVSSITNAVIRDRRKWARGAGKTLTSITDYVTSSATMAALDTTNLYPRFELSGAPVRVTLDATALVNGTGELDLWINGAANGTMRVHVDAGTSRALHVQWMLSAPTPGSYRIGPAFAVVAGTFTLDQAASIPLYFRVEELVRQDAANNSTTTG